MVIRKSTYDFSHPYDIGDLPGENVPMSPSGFGDADESNLNLAEPLPKIPLWRYTSVGKLRNVIAPQPASRGELFFYRAQKFMESDKYEGTIPNPALESAKNLFEGFHDPDNSSTEKWMKTHSQVAERMRRITYINCWRYGHRESDLMWEKFTSSDSGVVIKTNVRDFIESFEHWPGCLYIGETRYLHRKFDSVIFNRMTPFFIKRGEYRGEQELRAVITLSNEPPVKQLKPRVYPEPIEDDLACAEVNIDKLISKIIIHPDNRLLENVVEDMLQVANLDISVEKSSLK
jgi:hypothetical protein